MSKCSVRSTLKSSFRYWTLFCPKYCAELCVGSTSSPPVTRQHTTAAWKLCRTFMRLGSAKAVTFPSTHFDGSSRWNRCLHYETLLSKPDSLEDSEPGLGRRAQASRLRNPDGSSRQ